MKLSPLVLFVVTVAGYLGSEVPDINFDLKSGWLKNGNFPNIQSLGTPIVNVSKAVSKDGLGRLSLQFDDFSIARFHIRDGEDPKLVEYVSSPLYLKEDLTYTKEDGDYAKQGQKIADWLSSNEGTQVKDDNDLITQAVSRGSLEAWVPRGNWAGREVATIENGKIKNVLGNNIFPGDLIYGKSAYVVKHANGNTIEVYANSNGKIQSAPLDLSKDCSAKCTVFRSVPNKLVESFVDLFEIY